MKIAKTVKLVVTLNLTVEIFFVLNHVRRQVWNNIFVKLLHFTHKLEKSTVLFTNLFVLSKADWLQCLKSKPIKAKL